MNKSTAIKRAKRCISGAWKSSTWRIQIRRGFKMEMVNGPAGFSVSIGVQVDANDNVIPGTWDVRTWMDADMRSGFDDCDGIQDLDAALVIVAQRINRRIAALQALLKPSRP